MWQVKVNDLNWGEYPTLAAVRKFLRSIASGQVRVSKAGKGWDENADRIFAWETQGAERDFEITRIDNT